MQRPSERLTISKISFIAEQDGVSERDLKNELKRLFSVRIEVDRAYLARVHYGNPAEWQVSLCLAGNPTESLLSEIQNIFNKMFLSGNQLDLLVLNVNQESQIRKIVKPFYNASIAKTRQ